MKNLTLSLLLPILACSPLSAANYCVATNGSDSNSGTSLEKPFATIQRAIQQMRPGDTCYIRGGTYRESINLSGVAGKAGKPITLTAYKGEEVILNGTSKITSSWELDAGNIYKTKLQRDITQLFVDDELMTLARFPNASAYSDTVWTRNGARCHKSRESTNGHVVDASSGDKSIAETGVSLDGCVALLNFGAHATTSRIVENHKAGSSTFDYSPKLHKYKTTLAYFFEGGLGNAERVMLDSAEEWAYDEESKTLYLWADDGKTPSGRAIYGKVQSYAIEGDATTQHIVIDGIDFFSTTFSFQHSDHITIQNCDFDYYASSKRALGVLGPSDTAQCIGSAEDFCTDILIYNCSFMHADASAFIGAYVDKLRIENNLFKYIDYACVNNDLTGEAQGYQASIAICITKGRDLVYRRNTLAVSGNAQSVAASMDGVTQKRFKPDQHDPSAFKAPLFEYNFHTACGLLNTDGSSLYMAHSNVKESVSRYNWFIGNGQRDFRWDGNNLPLQGVHGNIYRNVSMDTGVKRMAASGGNGLRIKGSYHEVYHNLGINRGGELNVATEKGGNAQTITRNNAASHFTDNPIPGTSSNNYVGSKTKRRVQDMLCDPNNWDFRPKPDAIELIDQGISLTCSARGKALDVNAGFKGKAPDIGAYEHGQQQYWIPGRQEAHASMPIPKDQAEDVALSADLMYLIGLNGTTAEVFLGSSPETLQSIGTQSVQQNITPLPQDGSITKGKTYFWRVDTTKKDGTISHSPIWSFTTSPD